MSKGIKVKASSKRVRELAMVEKIRDVELYYPEKLGKREYNGHVQVKCYLRIGKARPSEQVVIKKIVQAASVLDSIDYRSMSVHLFKIFGHVFIKLHPFKKPVEKPAQKKSGLVIKDKRIVGFILKVIHDLLNL